MSDEQEEVKQVQTVPYERFKALNNDKQRLSQEIESLKLELQEKTEKVATFDNLNSTIEQLRAEKDAQQQKFESFKAIASTIGTMDNEAIETAEWQYGKLQVEEGADKPSMSEWLSNLKENPDKIPRPLQPFMVQNQEKPVEKVAHNQPKIGTSPPASGGIVTAEALKKAREKGRNTGDWSEFKKLSSQI